MNIRTSAEGRSGWRAACVALGAWIVLSSGVARAWEPINPNLSPEARRQLEYLHSIEGERIIAGMQRTGGGQGPFPAVLHKTGREPVLYGQDIAGFHPKGSDTYHQVLKGVVAHCRYWWLEKDGIVQLLFHWGNPMHRNGSAWKGRPKGSAPPDFGRVVTPGTEECEAFHKSRSYTADYLKQLAKARLPVLLAPLLVAVSAACAEEPNEVRQIGIRVPLRDAAVARAPGGTYYLTGTAGTYDKSGRVDFDYNRGVLLWRSDDLKTWISVGYAWDRVERLASSGAAHGRPWTDWSAPAERIDALLANATTTPKLYYIAGDWFLLCAQNNQNVFVFRSESGRPEGPYADHGYLATRGGWPSFFVDDEPSPPDAPGGRAVRAVYLVLADGWIARMKPDLKEAAEDIRPLLPASGAAGAGRLTLGDCGVALFKRNGRYQLLAARWFVRDGKPSHDAVLWEADNVYGPYHQTDVVLPDTGPVSVFQDALGQWQAVASHPVEDVPRILAIPAVR